MSDILGRIVSIFIAAIVIFLAPLIYMLQRMESAEQLFLITECTRFVDGVCSTGVITEKSLDALYSTLSKENSTYDVCFVYESSDVVINEDEQLVVTEKFEDEMDIRRAINESGSFIMERGAFLKIIIKKTSGFKIPYLPYDKTVSAYYGATVRGEFA